jgi:hypothetical protein
VALRVVVLAAVLALALALVGASRDDDSRVPPAPVVGPRVEGPKVAAAGDVACDPGHPSFGAGQGRGLTCRQLATSDLLVGAGYAAVLVLGDVQYEDGAYSKFLASYDPTWGRVKSVTRPVPGNHEYRSGSAAGYFRYFGDAAGDPAEGWYSFDLGAWHLIALNSQCDAVGGCDEGSDPTYEAFWEALHEAGADVVLVGHDHGYERFAPQAPRGTLDVARGIRQFVVGSGGRSLRPFPTVRPHSEARDRTSLGVLELTLGDGAYAWRFRPAVGSFTDRGSARCH